MNVALPRFTRKNLITLLVVLAGIITGLFVLSSPTPAHASTIGCGQIPQCYVDSTVQTESNWASEDYTGNDGSTVPGGGNGGGGGGPIFMTKYMPCVVWSNGGGDTRFGGPYPHLNSGSYSCGFTTYPTSPTPTCYGTSDRAANGKIDYYIERVNSDGSKSWVFARTKCVYPTDENAPIERRQGSGQVYTAGTASFYQTSTTPNAAGNTKHGGGGTLSNTTGYVDRGVNLNNPEAWTGSWKPAFTGKTRIKANGDPVYGYYRLDWTLDYRICVKWAYPSWLNVPVRYDCSQRGTDRIATPYTYACNFNPPLRTGIHTNALFTAPECDPKWSCVFTNPLTVGGQTAALTVMRNGEEIAVRYPTPSVAGSGIRDARSWQFNNAPVKGATPKLDYAQASWKWNTWDTYKQNGTLRFNWASDNGNPFKWTTKYRFTADWYLPSQATTSSPVVYKWVVGSSECPQTHSSQNIDVVRSVNG